MAVLTKESIIGELRRGQDGKGLLITPLKLDQVGPASVDLCLGNEFIVFKRASITGMDIRELYQNHTEDLVFSVDSDVSPGFDRASKALDKKSPNIHKYQEKKRISETDNFVLHPHQLVLGATREYIALPNNITADIVGRSTWGRTGLIIATATHISPNFKGCVTLELVNEGEIPLVLYPGLRVAQLVLSKTEGHIVHKGRYQYQTGPEFPRFEKELKYMDFHNQD